MVAWIAATALGGGVGLTELVTRYRDQPSALPKSVSFWVYILLNAAASALAFGLIQVSVGRSASKRVRPEPLPKS